MNKISHLVNSNIFNTINQNCVIINPIQTFQKKKITKYDEEEITNLALKYKFNS